ncbi:MAG: DUF3293 domain-containing protein [Pseudomonadota bacterium]
MKPVSQTEVLLTGSQRKKLDAVYRKAEYRVVVGKETLSFRIGEYDAAVEKKLFGRIDVQREWSILTPCNPRSQEATQEMNVFYYHELRDALAARSSLWLPASNHDPLGSWQDEPGFAIADADVLLVRDLGTRFSQNAYVSARVGEALRLVWLI